MATCDIIALRAAAVANRFAGLSPQQMGALELQFWYALIGSTKTVAQLKADACASGFTCVFGRAALAAKLQLLCNGGTVAPVVPVVPTECVNLVTLPGGVFYSSGSYHVGNFLEPLTTYQITFGTNDDSLNNPGGTPEYLESPGIFIFTTPSSVDSMILASTGFGGGLEITATICAI